jgi:hypothetical protein
MELKTNRFGALRRSTLSWCRSTRISASNAARDRNSPITAHQINLQRSTIAAIINRFVGDRQPLWVYVRDTYFPSIEEIEPFKDWDSNKPTQSLKWYAAYNKVKHDREAHFKQATLINAFTAAAAYFVMLCAEHGREVAARDEVAARKFFQLKKRPIWQRAQCYKPMEETGDGQRVFNKRCGYFSEITEERPPLTVRKAEEPRMSDIVLP